MSDETRPENGDPARRPHATLDLKAERVEQPSTEQASDGGGETSIGQTRGPEDAPSPREGGGVAGFLTHLSAGLLGGLIALVVGYYALGNFRDRLPFVAETSAEQIKAAQEDLGQRIADVADNSEAARTQLADRVSALDARTEGLAQTDEEAVAALTARVNALEQQLQDATDATDGTADAEQIASVRERVAALEKSLNTLRAALDEVRAQSEQNVAAVRASALAVALNNLRRSVDSGNPFTADWEAVRDLSAEPLGADTLAAAAEEGVPTLRELRQSFPEYANNALEAAGAASDDSLIGQIVESARSVVNVRPVGEIEGDSPRAIIARVENRLKAGDLTGVVAQSDQLSGEAAVQLLPWIEQVKTRIDANQELDALESGMLAAIRQ